MVKEDRLLFSSTTAWMRAAGAEARARARNDGAGAQHREGPAPRELKAILEAQLEQAGTQVELARSELQRQQQLLRRNFVQRRAST